MGPLGRSGLQTTDVIVLTCSKHRLPRALRNDSEADLSRECPQWVGSRRCPVSSGDLANISPNAPLLRPELLRRRGHQPLATCTKLPCVCHRLIRH
jgi:hypothetical protein